MDACTHLTSQGAIRLVRGSSMIPFERITLRDNTLYSVARLFPCFDSMEFHTGR
jgi:hypothetical protein